ncbi:MAG: YkgJ family cysteine cluster protein [Spirochaetaceae bacterium]|nr:MAG: YkgJ family cysteine cluster protein [Spirochaetaceae bacterium]
MPIQGDSFYSKGLRFCCTECSLCCRFDSGYVFLSQSELSRLADRFSLSHERFIERYCRVIDLGVVSRLTLREQKNLDCVFWKHGGCTVYEDRPLQCRSFPFWPAHMSTPEQWLDLERECPGINVGPTHTAATIDAWLETRERLPLLDPRRHQPKRGDGE